jgi:hypothetical protein
MSVLIGVLATAALFAAFGFLHRGRRPRIGCTACDGTCGRACRYDITESPHASR